jgi:hypothetical protein
MALTRLQRTVPAAFLTLPFGIAAMGEWLDRQELATAATEALVEARLREAKATTAAAASAAAPVEVG